MLLRESPRSSPTPSVASAASDLLTPTRKIKALLAQFSDSESDHSTRRQTTRCNPSTGTNFPREGVSESDDEDEDELLPRSRIANRLAGAGSIQANGNPSSNKAQESGVTQVLNDPTTNATNGREVRELFSSEDELSTFQPKRRFLVKRKSSPTQSERSPPSVQRSPSPLFFSSPSHQSIRDTTSPVNRSKAGTHNSLDGKSKFLALVEKHRRERLQKEAEKIAKRAGGDNNVEDDDKNTTRKPRGSSPADDTEESSDDSQNGHGMRLTREARPQRKAGKKALEEMNRETQRMSRNMQLAHQARTKKKITKESLLARFNFSAVVPETLEVDKESPTESSNPPSDADNQKDYSTPSTSPLRDLEAKDIRSEHARTESDLEYQLLQERVHERALSSGKGKDVDPEHTIDNFGTDSIAFRVTNLDPPALSREDFPDRRSKRIMRGMLDRNNDSSDSDLDIIADKGTKRKFIAFETLPKRKSKEKPSHIALRSLAHLLGNKDKTQSTNAAEMEAMLRRAARKQAEEARRTRIEELKAKGIVIVTAEEREREQQEIEDLVERARQEGAEIQKREKQLAKKDGTFVKDGLDDDDSDDEDEDDGNFEDVDENDEDEMSNSDGGSEDAGIEKDGLVDEAAEEVDSEEVSASSDEDDLPPEGDEISHAIQFSTPAPGRIGRNHRVLSDDEETDNDQPAHVTPFTLPIAKTPRTLPRSARKIIPGLQMSDDLPLNLSQAFAATMADSQTQNSATPDQDSIDITRDLPSPNIDMVPRLQRLESIDLIADSQPATQTQPLDIELTFSQLQVPESPITTSEFMMSQRPFQLTQDNGYEFSPFTGNRFAETPKRAAPHSTNETVILSGGDDSPIVQRKGKLRRGRALSVEMDDALENERISAFKVMQGAAKKKAREEQFDKHKSDARNIVDEAAEESEDEYAGLGGASDDDLNEEENEEDRKMIDEDTQIGKGDEAKLAGLYADRERKQDEAAVSKLLKDITTGALRRKRGVGDDLDLSDEEDEAARRRDAKRREFAKMRRELLKDEAVGKIAEDKKKEAFLRSIEDRETVEDDEDDDDDEIETQQEVESQSQIQEEVVPDSQKYSGSKAAHKDVLDNASSSKLNRLPPSLRRTALQASRKPTTLAEIRESVSFLIEEPDSQAGTIDLGLSDSEEEPEAYVDLDRHLNSAADNEDGYDDDAQDLGDFIIDDDGLAQEDSQDDIFKKPELPRKERAPFSERRTKNTTVIDRLSLIRQTSSSTSTTTSSTKMAFFSNRSVDAAQNKVPSLLRRATTNSSLGSMAGKENVSATGVTTSKTERGHAGAEKEFVRKGNGTRRNAVNYQARPSLREEKMSARAGVAKQKAKKAGKGGFLGGLFRGDSWA